MTAPTDDNKQPPRLIDVKRLSDGRFQMHRSDGAVFSLTGEDIRGAARFIADEYEEPRP